jgi:hypothetical protein
MAAHWRPRRDGHVRLEATGNPLIPFRSTWTSEEGSLLTEWHAGALEALEGFERGFGEIFRRFCLASDKDPCSLREQSDAVVNLHLPGVRCGVKCGGVEGDKCTSGKSSDNG